VDQKHFVSQHFMQRYDDMFRLLASASESMRFGMDGFSKTGPNV
jgi:hypothetical protein